MAQRQGQGEWLAPLLHGTHQLTLVPRDADPREPEAAAGDEALLGAGAYVPPVPVLPTAEGAREDRAAGITPPDMLASQVGAELAQQQQQPLAGLGYGGGGGVEAQVFEQAGEEERETVLHGVPLAGVAEKPHPGSGSSRIGARPGATQLVDPQTEAELAAAGLPGA